MHVGGSECGMLKATWLRFIHDVGCCGENPYFGGSVLCTCASLFREETFDEALCHEDTNGMYPDQCSSKERCVGRFGMHSGLAYTIAY